MIIKKENRGIIFGAHGQWYIKHALKYIMTEILLTFGFWNPDNSLFKDLYEAISGNQDCNSRASMRLSKY